MTRHENESSGETENSDASFAWNFATTKLNFRAWLNGNAMFYETFICFYVSEANLFVSVFVHKCFTMLNDVEYTTFKMFVTQMSNYLLVISFQLMFYETLHYRLARPLREGQRHCKFGKFSFSQVSFSYCAR